MKTVVTLALSAFILSACGSGSDSDPATGTSGGQGSGAVVDYSKLTAADVEPTVLAPASAVELETYLKNGLRLNVRHVDDFMVTPEVGIGGVGLPTAVADGVDDSSFARGFSETNTHVQGVDEADYVKYDGTYMYVIANDNSEGDAPDIRILQTDADVASVVEVGRVPSGAEHWGNVGEMYLNTDLDGVTESLITLRTSWEYFGWIEPAIGGIAIDEIVGRTENKVLLNSFNVSDPANPSAGFSLEIDGNLQTSRKIGNMLYLVTNYAPYVPYIEYFFLDDDALTENEGRIAGLTLDDLIPSVSINGSAAQALHQPEDCYLPIDNDDSFGHHSLLSIVAVDLSTSEITSAKCINSRANGIYASEDSLYVGASSSSGGGFDNSFTVVHKFTLGEQIAYRSTGVVTGILQWGDASFKMDEYQDHFRIVTTTYDSDWEPEHLLHILTDSVDTDEMQQVSMLPNESHPEAIGKPGEDIYAVRFKGERAFIVTFERMDPLYVLDLSEPSDPQIAGELEVPGFSTYLHPVDDNYLLGIGQNGIFWDDDDGVKTSLYDISDISAPVEINSIVYANHSYSPATNDLRAISFLRANEDQLRFAFPLEKNASGWEWEYSGLQQFEINGLSTGAATLSDAGVLVTERAPADSNSRSSIYTDRAVLHDDAVFFAHDGEVWSAFWANPDAALGPN